MACRATPESGEFAVGANWTACPLAATRRVAVLEAAPLVGSGRRDGAADVLGPCADRQGPRCGTPTCSPPRIPVASGSPRRTSTCGAALVLAFKPQLQALALRLGRHDQIADLMQAGFASVLRALGTGPGFAGPAVAGAYREFPAGPSGPRWLFATYAFDCARCAMLEARSGISPNKRHRLQELNRATRELGRPPEPGERAAGRTWTARRLAETRRIAVLERAVGAGSGDDGDASDAFAWCADSRAAAPDAGLLAAEEDAFVAGALAQLDARGRDVVARRHGLAPYDVAQRGPVVAAALGLSKQRVDQLRLRALAKLRRVVAG